MNWKWLVVLFALFNLGVLHYAYWLGRQQGWYDGNRYADRVYAERMEWMVEDQLRGVRRVQRLREQSEYERGLTACQK